jgi:hypothetical protein
MTVRVCVVALAFVLVGWTQVASAVTADEVLASGLRQFSLGNWQEAAEFLERFRETWPHHPKVTEAHGWQLIAKARVLGDDRSDHSLLLRRDLIEALGNLELDLPDTMRSDVELTLFHLEWYLSPRTKQLWAYIPTLDPQKLTHALDRGWIPSPSDSPLESLTWIASWTFQHRSVAPPLLRGRLALHRAMALWTIWTSPLAAQAREDQLQALGVWPVRDALVREIRGAFDAGNADVRRQAAIMGLSLERLHPRTVHRQQVALFQAYLEARGIHSQEAWIPR